MRDFQTSFVSRLSCSANIRSQVLRPHYVRSPMTDDPKTESLREWNRLARQNAENAIVSSMFESAFKASKPIEKFSTWLLVGTAAVAAFFITNADNLLPFITQAGFLTCGALLCASCLLGLISRMYALRCEIQIETGAAVCETFAKHLANHKEEEKKIKESAGVWGITLETGIRMDRVLSEFFISLPRWVAWFANRQLKKHSNNPQVGYLPVIKGLQRQGVFAFLQALLFLSFLVAGFAYAATI